MGSKGAMGLDLDWVTPTEQWTSNGQWTSDNADPKQWTEMQTIGNCGEILLFPDKEKTNEWKLELKQPVIL